MNMRVDCKTKPTVLLIMMMFLGACALYDPVLDQLSMFKKEHTCPAGTLTTTNGAPIIYREARNSLNTTSMVYNEFLMETITHGIREVISERVVFPKGAGAFGYFEVTNNISGVCKANLFKSVGKRTPVAVRFSPDVVERGGKDTTRDVRGFAVKFYTKEGNFDIVGINIPVFFLKDPILFPSLAHARRRNPATHLYDQNSLWDFVTLRPETLYALLYIYSDRGIPLSYRNMAGYSIHTYQLFNGKGDSYFVRFSFVPDLGIKNLSAKKAIEADADYYVRDLYRSIAIGQFPSWTVRIQTLTAEDVRNADFDVFDVTKTLPEDIYPAKDVGKLVLNKNAINYFAEIEQLAFSPANLVSGILGAPDKVFESRRLLYREAQFHRLGTNSDKILVNRPKCAKESTYIRDGSAPVGQNGKDYPNYYPNSFCGLAPVKEKVKTNIIKIKQSQPDNFGQATQFVSTMTAAAKERLAENLADSLKPAAKFLQNRAVKLFKKIDLELGNKIAEDLATNKSE